MDAVTLNSKKPGTGPGLWGGGTTRRVPETRDQPRIYSCDLASGADSKVVSSLCLDGSGLFCPREDGPL
jgi:hypothetical protein